MLRLTTHWGDYNLLAVVRIDIYATKEEDIYTVRISLDSHTHVLHSFESEKDSKVFVDAMKIYLRHSIDHYVNRDNRAHAFLEGNSLDLHEICKAAVHQAEMSMMEAENIELKKGFDR